MYSTILKLIVISTALILLTSVKLVAQDQTVTLTTSGQGETIEEARENALRTAIEQAFGAFISTRTEILNDELVSDQITSISNGNIRSYEVLADTKLPDGKWAVTLMSVVSITRLTSFVQASGVEVEIQGGLFAANIKQQLLNEQAEEEAVKMMVGLLHEIMQTAFDYTIIAGEPVSADGISVNWEIPLTVTATANENMAVAAEYFHNTMKALSLREEEIDSYRSLGKQVYKVENRSISTTRRGGRSNQINYSLRKESSFNTVYYLANNLSEAYLRLFAVDSGLDIMQGLGEMTRNHTFSESDPESRKLSIHFSRPGDRVGIFEWIDRRSLTEIGQMSGYSVEPVEVVAFSLKPKDVTNPITEKTWMDRNLGAMWVAISSKDAGAFGDLYQWGRASDGHEKRTSGTIREVSTTTTPGHGDFITRASRSYTWHTNFDNTLWQDVNGVNNPCPIGYRLPTEAEWREEFQSWDKNLNSEDGAFASPLKLTVAGYRMGFGSLNSNHQFGIYWSSTANRFEPSQLNFYAHGAKITRSKRNDGASVRCIKD